MVKVYLVDAASKNEAIKKADQNPETLLYVFAKEVTKSFWQIVKSQLLGE